MHAPPAVPVKPEVVISWLSLPLSSSLETGLSEPGPHHLAGWSLNPWNLSLPEVIGVHNQTWLLCGCRGI